MATDNQKLRQMTALVSTWRISGSGKKAFCATHNINIHTFNYWVEKVEKIESVHREEELASTTQTRGFIALSQPVCTALYSLDLEFPQGAILRMRGSLDTDSVALIKSLLY